MKKLFAAIVIGLSVLTLSLDASAARLGGGASFGRSMSLPKAPGATMKAPASSTMNKSSAAASKSTAAAGATKSMGLGKRLLMGAAAALGFMALANMLGLGEGFAQILMILALAALAMFAFRMFMARKVAPTQAGAAQATMQQPREEEPMMRQAEPKSAAYAASGVQAGSAMDEFSDAPVGASSFEVPADFDKDNFLNMSTAYFKMLQKAWDSGDMDSLENYCTQDMFIQLTHKRREIKGINLTEVVMLNADLAGFETTATEYVASVKFCGRLKENGEVVDIEEIWNLVKEREGKSGWLLAGIQQVA